MLNAWWSRYFAFAESKKQSTAVQQLGGQDPLCPPWPPWTDAMSKAIAQSRSARNWMRIRSVMVSKARKG